MFAAAQRLKTASPAGLEKSVSGPDQTKGQANLWIRVVARISGSERLVVKEQLGRTNSR